MLEDFNLFALPQRSFQERAEQVRIRMIFQLPNCLQTLAYDFEYLRHFTFSLLAIPRVGE